MEADKLSAALKDGYDTSMESAIIRTETPLLTRNFPGSISLLGLEFIPS